MIMLALTIHNRWLDQGDSESGDSKSDGSWDSEELYFGEDSWDLE
jgi:hypothetical protein